MDRRGGECSTLIFFTSQHFAGRKLRSEGMYSSCAQFDLFEGLCSPLWQPGQLLVLWFWESSSSVHQDYPQLQ